MLWALCVKPEWCDLAISPWYCAGLLTMFPGGFGKVNSTVCKLNYLVEGFGSTLSSVKGYILPSIMETFRVYNKNSWQWGFCSVCFIEMRLIRGWICDLLIPSSKYVSSQQLHLTWEVTHSVLLGLLFQPCLRHSTNYLTVSLAICGLFIGALHSMLLFLHWDLQAVLN